MPVTARLSRKFYETLGEEVTNELVDWLNAVDLSYRSEFRQLFETHFARFEARLAQQTAELRSELRAETGKQVAELRGESAKQIGELRAETGQHLAGLRHDTAELRDRIAATEKTLIRWMFTFWIGSWATMIGTLIALRQLGWLAGR